MLNQLKERKLRLDKEKIFKNRSLFNDFHTMKENKQIFVHSMRLKKIFKQLNLL